MDFFLSAFVTQNKGEVACGALPHTNLPNTEWVLRFPRLNLVYIVRFVFLSCTILSTHSELEIHPKLPGRIPVKMLPFSPAESHEVAIFIRGLGLQVFSSRLFRAFCSPMAEQRSASHSSPSVSYAFDGFNSRRRSQDFTSSKAKALSSVRRF